MIYLCSPYSHPDRLVQRTRFLIAEQFVVHTLRTQNLVVLSPIVYCHKLAEDNNLGTDAHFWMDFNINMLRRSEAMFFLKLKGWEDSKGCEVEMKIAQTLRIPIVEYDQDFNQISPTVN